MKKYIITITASTPEAVEIADNFLSEEYRTIEEAQGACEGLTVEKDERNVTIQTLAGLRMEIQSNMDPLAQEQFLATLRKRLGEK